MGTLPAGPDEPTVAIDLVEVTFDDVTPDSGGDPTELYQLPLLFAAST